VTTEDIYPQYIPHVLSFVDVKKIKPFTVVVDAGNGMSGKVVPMLEKYLPVKVIRLNFELDGNFPAHPSNPLMPESQVAITQAVREHKADFGVIFDGDTDRLFFVDEKGQFIRADFSLLVLAKEFLRREPGKGIVYNVICSKIVPEKIVEWGGKPLRSKVGYVNISMMMREQDGIMGGELSAHYSFRDNATSDSGFISWLILMQLISEDGRKLSEIISEFQRYAKSDEINIEVEDRNAVVSAVKKKFADGKQDELDGLTVEYDQWWFNVRSSNTEPLLRITAEADSEELLSTKSKELLSFINSVK
jgi:phosphomannomutase